MLSWNWSLNVSIGQYELANNKWFFLYIYFDCLLAFSNDSIDHGGPGGGHDNPVLKGPKCEEQLPNVEPCTVRSAFG